MVTESMMNNSMMTTYSMMTTVNMTTDNMITSETNNNASTNKEIGTGMLTETCNKGKIFSQCCCPCPKFLAWLHWHMLHVPLFMLYQEGRWISSEEKE